MADGTEEGLARAEMERAADELVRLAQEDNLYEIGPDCE